MFDSPTYTILFSSFVASCRPQIDTMSVLEEVYQIQSKYPSEEISNEGGYHSPVFSGGHFIKLRDLVREFVDRVLEEREYDLRATKMEYWCNINKSHNYNVLHNHCRTDLIGLYYVKVPPKSGNFVAVRNDGSQYTNLYNKRLDMLKYSVEPEEGQLYILPGHLWHYVTGNDSEEDRISISFNIDT